MKGRFWNIILAVLGICVVSLGVVSDQSRLKEEDMNSIYGAGTCKKVTTVPHPSCTPTTCPESGYITQKNYGVHVCTDDEAILGFLTCIPLPLVSRDECETWIYETSACTETIYHTVTRGPILIATEFGPCP